MALAALADAVLRTRTYLASHAFSNADASVLAALQSVSMTSPFLSRWRATCAAHTAAAPSALSSRVARLEQLAATVQNNFPAGLAPSPEVLRVERALAGLPGSALLCVRADYYSLTLRERARLLHVPVAALCKTLVLENPAGSVVGDATAPLAAQRYIAVVLQYTAKLVLPALCKGVGAAALALAAEGRALTGFAFNGLTPFGSLTALPVVLARDALDCKCPYILLGGGQEDVKARVFLRPLAALPGVTVLACSAPRPEEEWEQ